MIFNFENNKKLTRNQLYSIKYRARDSQSAINLEYCRSGVFLVIQHVNAPFNH